MPGVDPSATLDKVDGKGGWNTWQGAAFLYNETMHPTYWVGSRAVEWLQKYAAKTSSHPISQRVAGSSSSSDVAKPFLLKVSFHRPHSPYDPPKRILDAIRDEDLPKQTLCKAACEEPGQGCEDPPRDDSGRGEVDLILYFSF